MSAASIEVVVNSTAVLSSVSSTRIDAVLAGGAVSQTIVGVPGPRGLMGLTGSQGLQGIEGDTGLTGGEGPQGPTGLTGPAGADGADGADGALGPLGPIGLTGPVGADGAAGSVGPQGLTGLTGPAGAAGVDGAAGADGTDGADGAAGADGAVGSPGASGDGSGDVVGPATSGVGNIVQFQNVSGDLVGDTGLSSADIVQISSANVTINVPADQPTIQDALDALLAYRFSGAARGIVNIATGTYSISSPLKATHPQPGAITLKAVSAGTVLVQSDFTGTKATDETMVRSKFNTIIDCTGHGIEFELGQGIGVISQIAFIGTTSKDGIEATQGRALATIDNTCFFGFAKGMDVANSASLDLFRVTIAHCNSIGIHIQNSCALNADELLSLYNVKEGLNASSGVELILRDCAFDNNSKSGLSVATGTDVAFTNCSAKNNGLYGFLADGGCALKITTGDFSANTSRALNMLNNSFARIYKATVLGTSTQKSIFCTGACAMDDVGSHVGAPVFSPAAGTTGNNNSITY